MCIYWASVLAETNLTPPSPSHQWVDSLCVLIFIYLFIFLVINPFLSLPLNTIWNCREMGAEDLHPTPCCMRCFHTYCSVVCVSDPLLVALWSEQFLQSVSSWTQHRIGMMRVCLDWCIDAVGGSHLKGLLSFTCVCVCEGESERERECVF